MSGDLPRNVERRAMYAFKNDLERVIRKYQLDIKSGIPAHFIATYLIRQYVAIDTLLENLEYKNDAQNPKTTPKPE